MTPKKEARDKRLHELEEWQQRLADIQRLSQALEKIGELQEATEEALVLGDMVLSRLLREMQ